jgi:hypothetical protein
MNLRHFAPLTLAVLGGTLALAGLIARLMNYSAALPLYLLLFIVGSHLLLGLMAGVQVGIRERNFMGLLLPPVILGFHFAYGIGSLAGFFWSRDILPPQTTNIALSAKSSL